VRSLALLALALLLAAPAAAAGGQGGRKTGVLRGIVTRGPVAPLCTPALACREPARDVTLVFLRDERAVARTTTGRRRLPGRPRRRSLPDPRAGRLAVGADARARPGRARQPARRRDRHRHPLSAQ